MHAALGTPAAQYSLHADSGLLASRAGVREGLDACVERVRLKHGLQRVLPVVQAHEAQQQQEQQAHEAACTAIEAHNDAAREEAVRLHQQQLREVQELNQAKVSRHTCLIAFAAGPCAPNPADTASQRWFVPALLCMQVAEARRMHREAHDAWSSSYHQRLAQWQAIRAQLAGGSAAADPSSGAVSPAARTAPGQGAPAGQVHVDVAGSRDAADTGRFADQTSGHKRAALAPTRPAPSPSPAAAGAAPMHVGSSTSTAPAEDSSTAASLLIPMLQRGLTHYASSGSTSGSTGSVATPAAAAGGSPASRPAAPAAAADAVQAAQANRARLEQIQQEWTQLLQQEAETNAQRAQQHELQLQAYQQQLQQNQAQGAQRDQALEQYNRQYQEAARTVEEANVRTRQLHQQEVAARAQMLERHQQVGAGGGCRVPASVCTTSLVHRL